MQFDNIEYFAKTKQNFPTECTHTLACGDEWVNQCTHTLACGDEGVKRCTRAFRACSFTAWFSQLKCFKSDRKIQDMGQKMYIFTFHIVKIAQRVPFFLQNTHDYK